jgi:hypothetical protein
VLGGKPEQLLWRHRSGEHGSRIRISLLAFVVKADQAA